MHVVDALAPQAMKDAGKACDKLRGSWQQALIPDFRMGKPTR